MLQEATDAPLAYKLYISHAILSFGVRIEELHLKACVILNSFSLFLTGIGALKSEYVAALKLAQ